MKLTILAEDRKYRAAVAIVKCRDKWLLGLAKDTGDSRTGNWCFPGGHIKSGELPKTAAVREAKEETGVRCSATNHAIIHESGKPDVAFVVCNTTSSTQKLTPNHEFVIVGFFTPKEMKGLKLFDNVKRLIDKAKS